MSEEGLSHLLGASPQLSLNGFAHLDASTP